MTIRFFNTLAGRVEDLKPIREGEVRMYTCGPTVYDYAHIGNFRAFVFEDLLRRFLEFKGYQVKHVMNLTDVDDKTIAGALREGKKLEEFTGTYTKAFQEDLKTLNILSPNHPAEPPRATREVPAMLELIDKLVKKGVGYASDGSVYYRISQFPNYGKLSKKKLEMNIAGASERVDADEYDKEQVSDFVLWKKAKEGEPSWPSPWGLGRPGWHIECSAMSMKYLGETFDLHAGGEDLIFPHHENEIAQSEAATGKKFVNTWLHCKFLLVNGEKMSKSKDNFYTLRDLLAKGYDPMAIRYALLSTHYRTPLNFTLDGLKEAGEIIKKLDDCYWQCVSRLAFNLSSSGSKSGKTSEQRLESLGKELSNDLNVAASLAGLVSGVTEINSSMGHMNEKELQDSVHFFKEVDRLFGFDVACGPSLSPQVNERLSKLQEFRKSKNFQEADKMRAELKEQGWLVKDGRPGEPSTVKKIRRVWDK